MIVHRHTKFRWQLELPTPDHLRENRYGFLRLAPCYVLIVPMAFIARRAAKLAVVSLADVAGPSFGARDPSRWPLAAPSFNSASRAQGVMKLDLGSQRSVRPVPSPRLSRFLLLRHPYVHDALRDIAACSYCSPIGRMLV